MELSRIEQILISAAVFLSVLVAAGFIHFRDDIQSLWDAGLVIAAGVLFYIVYANWYASNPVTRPHAKQNERRCSAAAKLRQARKAEARIQRKILFTGITLLLVAVVAALLSSRTSPFVAWPMVALAGVCGYACWLHFPAQAAPLAPDGSGDSVPPTLPDDQAIQRNLDVLKLEYTTGAERYENIYKAIWQNFSYMSVVSAGILTFGQKSLSSPVLVFLAVTPVFFWYFATFLPMDNYGQEVRTTLRRVEKFINATVDGDLLSHFTNFADYRFHWRVRDPVRAFGTTLCYLWIASLLFATSHVARTQLDPTSRRDFANVLSAELRYYEKLQPPADTALLGQLRRLEQLMPKQRARADSTSPFALVRSQPVTTSASHVQAQQASDTAGGNRKYVAKP